MSTTVLKVKKGSFKKELIALLEKYEATIAYIGEGDFHGIYGEKICVTYKENGEQKAMSMPDQHTLDATDLKDEFLIEE